MVYFRFSIPPWSLRQCPSYWFKARSSLHIKLAASSIIKTLEIAKWKWGLILIFFIRIFHIHVFYCILKRILKYLEIAKASHVFFFICVHLRFTIMMADWFWVCYLVVYYIDYCKTIFTWFILWLMDFLLFYWRMHFYLNIWKFKFEYNIWSNFIFIYN